MIEGNIGEIKLTKGMTKEEVNELIGEWLTLEDDVYLGNSYKHSWTCKCGNVFIRRWGSISSQNRINCGCIEYNKQEQRYKYEVEKDGEYEYIRSFRKGDKLPNGELVRKHPYIQVKHKYCGNVYEVVANSFINERSRCGKCCGSYENSFAYYIEKILGEPLDRHWNFDKNTVNPYHIWKNSNKKVWIKCKEKDYHNDDGGYEIVCSSFTSGNRCSYCGNHKVHPKDSFAQYHIDNRDKDFLNKYWSDKNTVDPWSISPYSNKKVWIKCQEKNYHGSYEVSCGDFTKGVRCGYCNGKKVHVLDSFGYKHFDKVLSWHPDNDISPFKIAPSSDKKYKFICPECGFIWKTQLNSISKGSWCPQCASSKGEKRINSWLRLNDIEFIPQKEFDGLLGLGGKNLSYDFYLPEYNLLIEYQGEFHDGTVTGSYRNFYDFDRQKEHDKRKREYAKENNIGLLEIWYWDFDNIEEILYKQIKCKINLTDIKNIA